MKKTRLQNSGRAFVGLSLTIPTQYLSLEDTAVILIASKSHYDDDEILQMVASYNKTKINEEVLGFVLDDGLQVASYRVGEAGKDSLIPEIIKILRTTYKFETQENHELVDELK